jgi:hypothetical protein
VALPQGTGERTELFFYVGVAVGLPEGVGDGDGLGDAGGVGDGLGPGAVLSTSTSKVSVALGGMITAPVLGSVCPALP